MPVRDLRAWKRRKQCQDVLAQDTTRQQGTLQKEGGLHVFRTPFDVQCQEDSLYSFVKFQGQAFQRHVAKQGFFPHVDHGSHKRRWWEKIADASRCLKVRSSRTESEPNDTFEGESKTNSFWCSLGMWKGQSQVIVSTSIPSRSQ